jgi:hypothetical protein
MAGRWCLNQFWWRFFTWARSRSVATSDFFICVPELAQEPSDGGSVRGNTSGSFQCSRKFWQGDIAILRYQFFQKRLMTGQLPMAKWAALGFWLDRTRLRQLALPSYASGGG